MKILITIGNLYIFFNLYNVDINIYVYKYNCNNYLPLKLIILVNYEIYVYSIFLITEPFME